LHRNYITICHSPITQTKINSLSYIRQIKELKVENLKSEVQEQPEFCTFKFEFLISWGRALCL